MVFVEGVMMAGGDSSRKGIDRSLIYKVSIRGAMDETEYRRGVEEVKQKILSKMSILKKDLTNDQKDALSLATSELMTNAYHHGNGCDLSKKVSLMLYQLPEGVLFLRVADEGTGFDINSLPNPKMVQVNQDSYASLDEQISAMEQAGDESGMGIYLIKNQDPVLQVLSEKGKGNVDVYLKI